MKTHQRSAGLLLTITLAAVLSAGCSRTESSALPAVVGTWSVTYGAPTVVHVESTTANSYSMKATSPVTITGGSACQLPTGTTIATFSGQGSTYTGQHDLWNRIDCRFLEWTALSMTLNGDSLVENLGNGEVHNLTRTTVASAKNHSTLWLWAVAATTLASLLAYLLFHRRHRGAEQVSASGHG